MLWCDDDGEDVMTLCVWVVLVWDGVTFPQVLVDVHLVVGAENKFISSRESAE